MSRCTDMLHVSQPGRKHALFVPHKKKQSLLEIKFKFEIELFIQIFHLLFPFSFFIFCTLHQHDFVLFRAAHLIILVLHDSFYFSAFDIYVVGMNRCSTSTVEMLQLLIIAERLYDELN